MILDQIFPIRIHVDGNIYFQSLITTFCLKSVRNWSCRRYVLRCESVSERKSRPGRCERAGHNTIPVLQPSRGQKNLCLFLNKWGSIQNATKSGRYKPNRVEPHWYMFNIWSSRTPKMCWTAATANLTDFSSISRTASQQPQQDPWSYSREFLCIWPHGYEVQSTPRSAVVLVNTLRWVTFVILGCPQHSHRCACRVGPGHYHIAIRNILCFRSVLGSNRRVR